MNNDLPVEFQKKMKNFLRDEWEDFLYSYNNSRYQALRINKLKVENDDAVLEKLGIEKKPVEWADNGYYYSEDAAVRPGKHPYHEMGLYYIQEPSAMSSAALLAPKPGMRVLDLCAAPGGKSTQLASYLQNQGLLISNEINNNRCKILSSNIERMGIKNAIVTNEDSFVMAEHFPSYFHGIVVDAPCSGEGMFRKIPEARDEWSPENVLLCASRQKEILDNAATMLMEGGCLVYSTCTFSREENEDVIEDFLKRHSEFSLVEEHRFWPHKVAGEGHFAAKLIKSGILSLQDYGAGKKYKNPLSKEQEKLLEEFLDSTLENEVKEWILNGDLRLFKDQLYRLPDNAPDLKGIHVLRAGLHIGEFKSKRFEPAFALALALRPNQVKKCVRLNVEDKRAWDYYEGLGLFFQEEEYQKAKGWYLLCIDSFSAGWGKMTGGQLKNHYPKGLRRKLD